MFKKLLKYLENADEILLAKKIARIFLLAAFPAIVLLVLKFVYLVKTEFRYSQSAMDFVSILTLFFLLVFGVVRFVRKNYMVGLLYILATYFIYLSLNNAVTFEVRKAAGRMYISNNSDIANKIKSERNIYYLDAEKEREAVFFDADGAFKNGIPSNDWLKHNAEFNACPFWAIPIDEDVYLINFGCKGF